MKINISIDIEIPFAEGEKWSPELMQETVWDMIIHTAQLQHLERAMKWAAKAEENESAKQIMEVHGYWADVIKKAKYKITEVTE